MYFYNPFYFDTTMLILIPAIILTIIAQAQVSGAYNKYSRIKTQKGFTGAKTARAMLDQNGLFDVRIELVSGKMSDHYDPRTRVLRLSDGVYYGDTVAANSIAAHEVGHAIQHAKAYAPLTLRNALVPVVNFSTNISWVFMLLGIFLSTSVNFFTIGVWLFSASVIFQLITLPVELNASRRAINLLGDIGVLTESEIPQGRKMLNAAAMTYVAAAATSIAQLARLLVLRNRYDRR